MRASINDGSVYDDNFTLLQKIRELSRRVTALENGGGGGGGSYELPTASHLVKGGIKVGDNLYMTGEYLNAENGGSYDLPIASADTLGGVMIGDGLSIDDAGVLSTNGGGGGGGKEIQVSGRALTAGSISSSEYSYAGTFLFGIERGVLGQIKDYTTPLTFTNEEDPTDTKTLYLQNSSWDNEINFMLLLEESGSGSSEYVPMYQNGNYIIDKQGHQYIQFYQPRSFALFDTTSQEEAQPTAQWCYVKEHTCWGEFGPDSEQDGLYTVSQVEGTITKMETTIDGQLYEWTGSIDYSDIVKTGSDAYCRMAGYNYFQVDA